MAPGLRKAREAGRTPTLEDVLLTPNPYEDPLSFDLVTPHYQTHDRRCAPSDPTFNCDSCERGVEKQLPGEDPKGAFLFRASAKWADTFRGLPRYEGMFHAHEAGLWNRQWACRFCLCSVYGMDIDGVMSVLREAANALIPPAFEGAQVFERDHTDVEVGLSSSRDDLERTVLESGARAVLMPQALVAERDRLHAARQTAGARSLSDRAEFQARLPDSGAAARSASDPPPLGKYAFALSDAQAQYLRAWTPLSEPL